MNKTPFTIHVAQTTLDDLALRLARTRLPDAPADAGWSLGTDIGFMQRLLDHWRTRYDFRKHEAQLNQLPQFKADIDGMELHFVHARGKGPNATPLLLLHGWPDSFYRYHKVIERLTDPAKFGGDPARSFDVIVPSLPGFGFSARRAMDVNATADVMLALMRGLGYERFIAGGGDLGSLIAIALSRRAPEALLGLHVSDVGYPDGSTDFSALGPEELEFANFVQGWWMREGAFNMVQATKPQSLAFALQDSPAGLAAWILSMMASGAEQLEERFTLDELITNITLYWVTETVASSMRTYAENARAMYANPSAEKPARSAVKAGVIHMPLDAPLPRAWAERHVNLVHFSEMPRGGHFAAWEAPEEYARELQAFAGVASAQAARILCDS
jgi:pimeloyl-ACP methyl ester carboxylesterase